MLIGEKQAVKERKRIQDKQQTMENRTLSRKMNRKRAGLTLQWRLDGIWSWQAPWSQVVAKAVYTFAQSILTVVCIYFLPQL